MKLESFCSKRRFNRPTFDIGSWSYQIFQDENNIEVNIPPYSQNQRYEIIINGKKQHMTTAELADKFIFSIANELGLPGESGHKHIDIAESFRGNVELLFRLAVDMETNAWLPRVLGRETRTSVFRYASQNTTKSARITSMVQAVNNCILKQITPRTGGYPDIVSLKTFLNGIGMNDKQSACALHHLDDFGRTTSMDVLPSTTVELRQFHCPLNGAEVDFINRLILGRLDFLAGCQKRRQPINYSPVDPTSYSTTHDKTVLQLYGQYLQECNLTLADGKVLLSHSQISKQLLDQFTCTFESHDEQLP